MYQKVTVSVVLLHINGGSPAPDAPVCSFWMSGGCRFGESCRNRHVGTPGEKGGQGFTGSLLPLVDFSVVQPTWEADLPASPQFDSHVDQFHEISNRVWW